MSQRKEGVKRPAIWYDEYEAGASPGLVCTDDRTRQSAKDECDVNVIVKRFGKTGVLPSVAGAFYADVADVGEYREVVARVEAAGELFGKLPAKTRLAFRNSPMVFLEALADPDQRSLLEELGVFEKAPVVPPGSQEGPTGSEAGGSPPKEAGR